MHVQHARPPSRHLLPLALPFRHRAGLRRPRRQSALLVARETVVRARNHQSPAHARGRRVQCGMESRRQVGRQRRRRRSGQGLCADERGAAADTADVTSWGASRRVWRWRRRGVGHLVLLSIQCIVLHGHRNVLLSRDFSGLLFLFSPSRDHFRGGIA